MYFTSSLRISSDLHLQNVQRSSKVWLKIGTQSSEFPCLKLNCVNELLLSYLKQEV